MRNTFLFWLFVFVAIAFIVTLGMSFFIQTDQTRANAAYLIGLKIEDAKKQIRTARENVETVRSQTDANALIKARALAEFIRLDPAMLKDRARLEATRRLLDVDELHVSDEKGILIASIPEQYQGYDMASSPQSAAFMPCITDPAFELAQDPKPKGIDQSKIFQYVGVARKDRPGIVQIGYQPKRLQEAMEVADIANLSTGFRIGTHGTVMVSRNKIVVSSANPADIGKTLAEIGVKRFNYDPDAIDYIADIDGEKHICVNEPYDDYMLVGVLPYKEIYLSRNGMIVFLLVSNLILFGVVFVLVSELVQRMVINGIYKVNHSLAKIAAGDLSERIEVNSSREFVELSNGINSTVAALKTAIAEAKERIDAELRFAKAIQHSAIPTIFPPYPERTEFEIFASMDTAKEVGGDFYDFFFIDDDHLALLIADVSDKGIPAALFMMTSKTMIKSLAESGLPPGKIFTEANRNLCEHNETGMFVTALMGILEISTGKLTCVNAGHCQPLLQKHGGRYEFLKLDPGLVLAGVEHSIYREIEIQLEPGDRLCFYTDGVTEALNADQELFSDARLLKILRREQARSLSVTELLPYIRREIATFAGNAEQADDITMLAFEYKGKSRQLKERTLPAKLEKLGELIEFVTAELKANHCPPRAQAQIILAVEEIFVNIASYAYTPAAGEATIRCSVTDCPLQVEIQFLDCGTPYNPLDEPAPDTTQPLETRETGGLGILLAKASMDDIDYEYTNGRNILTIKKRLADA